MNPFLVPIVLTQTLLLIQDAETQANRPQWPLHLISLLCFIFYVLCQRWASGSKVAQTSSHCSALRMPAHQACTPSLETACWIHRFVMGLFPWNRPSDRRAPGSPRRSAELGGDLACSVGTAGSAIRGWSPCPAVDSDGELTEYECAQWECLERAESWPPGGRRLDGAINDIKA